MLAREHRLSSLGSPAKHRSFSRTRNDCGQRAPAAVVPSAGDKCATPTYTRITSLPRGKSGGEPWLRVLRPPVELHPVLLVRTAGRGAEFRHSPRQQAAG